MEPAQFERLLYQGRGQAVLHLQQHAAAPYRAALRTGCVQNPCYDRPCEGHRAVYYRDLITQTGEEGWYRDQIMGALRDYDDEDDLDQLLALALWWAQGGDAEARQQLYDHVAAQAREGATIGAEYLIALDGAAGFRFAAERLGEAALLGTEVWDNAGLLDDLATRDGADTATAYLRALRDTSPAARAYLELVEAEQQRLAQLPRSDMATVSYPELRERLAGRDSDGPLRLRRWGEYAHGDDLAAAARDLLAEADPKRQAVQLLIFDPRPFPFGPEPLLPLLASANERVVQRTYHALARLHHPLVRALALQLLAERRALDHAIGLLAANYLPGDYAQVEAALHTIRDDDTLHAAGFDLLDVVDAQPSADAVEALLLLYERGPCALCRERIVARLHVVGTIPAWVLAECRFDANEELRSFVAKIG